MTQTSRPWNGITTGDAGPYTDAQWQALYRGIIGLGANRANSGVFLMSGTEPNDGLKVQAQVGPTNAVDVLAGAALVQGIAYLNTATVAFTIAANGSGNPRIDTVIVSADYALQTVRLAVLQGTPAASPVAPSLTQTAGVLWQIPIADVAVANGFSSISNSNISPRQNWVNAPPGLYLDHVLNNSGGTLNDGDVVIWDTTADRAVTTTTTQENDLVAGVWRGQTASGSYGRMQTEGIGYVNTNAAITRGNILVTSTTAKQATITGLRPYARLARALETTSGSGLCLCNIRIQTERALLFVQTADKVIGATQTETTLFSTGIGTLTIPANLLIAGALIEIELRGDLSTNATPGTLTIRAKIGGTTVCATNAVAPTGSLVNNVMSIRVLMTVRTGGSSGSLIANGEAIWNIGAVTLQRGPLITSGATTINCTTALTLDMTWQFSTANAGEGVTINEAVVRISNAA